MLTSEKITTSKANKSDIQFKGLHAENLSLAHTTE